LSLSQVRAVFLLSVPGWTDKDLARLYNVDTLGALRIVWRQKRELRQRHSAGYGVLRLALAQRQRWVLGRMVLSGHRQVVLVRPADTTLVLHVLHYPEHVRVCPQTVWPMKQEPQEELRLAGMLIDAADGKVDWTAYADQSAQELKTLIEAKLAGQPAEAAAPPRTILSLLDALKQSVDGQNGKSTAPKAGEKR
jgi:non-homologous end joining protein Ku